MLSVEEALARLTSQLEPTTAETVPLADAAGRVLAHREIVASEAVPGFANSSMDGFAVRAADTPGTLPLTGESRAGAPPPRLAAASAVRILTGAPLPHGADAVVPLEEAGESAGVVTIAASVAAGAHVRPAGLDVAAGTSVRLPAEPLTPATIALLAAMGRGEVRVRRRPRVAILSTGDELVRPGEALGAAQIHDANAPALAAAAEESGAAAWVLERAPDDEATIEARLRAGAARADLVVVSGGVSVGRRDLVRHVIERLGRLDFWRIAVQPGKPLAFGRIGDIPVLGLPGNPVSALVTFELFARPMLRAMLGLTGDGRVHLRVHTGERLAKDAGRRAYLRVRVERTSDGYCATSAGGQGSSQILPLAWANALLVVPEGIEATEPGADYEAIIIGSLP